MFEQIDMTATIRDFSGAMQRLVERHPSVEIGLMVTLRPCAEDAPWDGRHAQPADWRFCLDLDRTMLARAATEMGTRENAGEEERCADGGPI